MSTQKITLRSRITPANLLKEFESGIKVKDLAVKYAVTNQWIRQNLKSNEKAYKKACKLHKYNVRKKKWDKFHALFKLLNRFPTLEETVFLLELNILQEYVYLVADAKAKGYSNNALSESKKQKQREEMLIHLKELAKNLKRTPGMADLNTAGKYWGPSYAYFFGSLSKAQKLAGLKPNAPGNSKERIQRMNAKTVQR